MSSFIRVEPDDPSRCQANGAYGQCPFKALDGGNYCPRHGNNQIAAKKQREHRNYNLHRIRADMEKKIDSPEIKSLREEIALIRLILEKIVNRCEDDADLMLESDKIGELVSKVQTLVTSCHKIEISSQHLLDRNAIINIATNLIEVIVKHVKDPDIIDLISEEIPQVISVLDLKDGTSISNLNG